MSLAEACPDTGADIVPSAQLLAERLSNIPDNFAELVLNADPGSPWYPLCIDGQVCDAYTMASERLPQPTPGTSGVVLIVGNGCFETASQLLPPDAPIIFCDINPRMLYAQRTIIEMLRVNDTPEAFLETVDDQERLFTEFCKSKEASTFQRLSADDYNNESTGWRGQSTPYFTFSQEAYDQAKAAVMDHSYGFRLIDLGDRPSINELAEDLEQENCSIVCANFTNVFDGIYAGYKGARTVKNRLPFAKGARIIASKRDHSLLACNQDVRYWLEIALEKQ